jgi:Galactose oxidase-like, Early set domain
LTEKSDPSVYGQWEPIRYKFDSLPIHMALLHTGKVLAFGGSGNDPKYLTSPRSAEIFEPGEIDKNNSKIYSISNQGIEGDIFCCGHASLPDGKILIAGGTSKYDGSIFSAPIPPFRGLNHSYLFDPLSLIWQRLSNMKYARWYPTCIMMADGKVVIMAGLTDNFPWAVLNKIEIFDLDKWETLQANHWLPLYPRLHLLPTGEIFYAGSFNTHYTFPFNVRLFPSATLNLNTRKWKSIGNPKNVRREEGTTVLLPMIPSEEYAARVLLIAGGTPQGKDAINDVEIIDFSKDNPKYVEFASLRHARYYVYPVILPDRSILVLGGKSGPKGHLHEDSNYEHHHHPEGEQPHHPDAILEPELLDPDTNEWTPMADMKVDRLYHSNALLLPDGRVMSAGSNPQRTMNELRIEIFRPPYLFAGPRPVIGKCPPEIQYEKNFEIESSDVEVIGEVCLIRSTVTTHCVNTEQRYVGLEFSKLDTNTIRISIPSNRNLAPPGYYMLFIINQRKVPSTGHFVHLS